MGLPCRDRPSAMYGYSGLDLGVAVHYRYYCRAQPLGLPDIPGQVDTSCGQVKNISLFPAGQLTFFGRKTIVNTIHHPC